MKNLENKRRILKVFFTRRCKQKFFELQRRLKTLGKNKVELYHIGDHLDLVELTRFDVDVVVEDFENDVVYMRNKDFFVKANPFI